MHLRAGLLQLSIFFFFLSWTIFPTYKGLTHTQSETAAYYCNSANAGMVARVRNTDMLTKESFQGYTACPCSMFSCIVKMKYLRFSKQYVPWTFFSRFYYSEKTLSHLLSITNILYYVLVRQVLSQSYAHTRGYGPAVIFAVIMNAHGLVRPDSPLVFYCH